MLFLRVVQSFCKALTYVVGPVFLIRAFSFQYLMMNGELQSTSPPSYLMALRLFESFDHSV